MKRKIIAVVMACCIGAGLIACGNADAGAADVPNDAQSTAEIADAQDKQTEQAAAEGSGYNGEKVSITVFNEWVGTHPFAGYFDRRLEEFRKAYPNIEVNVEEIAGSSTANMDAKLKVQISSGELPDAFYTNDKSIIDLARKSDLLQDMKTMLDQDEEFRQDLDMTDIETWNEGTEHVYGICSSKDFFGYFYNKRLLKEAGYDKFPESWEEFYVMCDKLKENGVAPMSLETKTAWYSSLTMLATLAGNSETGNKMANTVGVVDYNTPEFIEAAENLQNMFLNYTTVDAPGSDVSVALNNFTGSQTAMVLDGAWRISELTDSPVGGDLDVALIPGNGAIAYPAYAWFSGSKDELKAAAAYEFIKWMSNRDDQALRLEMLGAIPASTNVDYTKMELSELMVKLLEMREKTDYTVLSCWRVYPASVTAIVPQELAALATGQNTPEQFASNLTKASD